MNRRFVLYFTAANAIGIFFLWMAARDLPFDQIGPYLKSADIGHLALWSIVFVAVYAVCHAARVLRWDSLVQPLGDVDSGLVHRASVVGFAAILLLPLRLGEVVRPYLLSRRTNLDVSSLLATAVVERVIDGLLVTGLLFLTLVTYGGERATEFATTTGVIAAAIFLPALIVCILAAWSREWTMGLIETLGRPLSDTLTEKVLEILGSFIEGFKGLAHRGALGRFFAATAVYWSFNVISMWLLAYYGFGLEVGLWDMTTVLAILVIGIMIPAGPALAGNFEYFLTRGLMLFVAVEVADIGVKVAVFAAGIHILQFFVIVIPGFWVMWVDPEARHLVSLSERGREVVSESSDAK